MPQKTPPGFHSIFEGLFASKMEPQASRNEAKRPPKCLLCPSSFSCRFFDRFREACCSFSEGPDPRFACYLQGFRGVQLFSQSSEKFQKRPSKMIQNDSQNTSEALKKSIQKRSRKTRRTSIEKAPKMKPKWSQKGTETKWTYSPGSLPKTTENKTTVHSTNQKN